MPVDKFGRNGDRTRIVYTGINIENLTNSFLRRDVSGDINLKFGFDLVRSLGCNDLSAGKKFKLLLET